MSRVTITLDGASHPIDQVTKQLHKLVNVIKIRDLEPEETIAREMALFKVSADGSSRAEIMQLADIFRGRIIDVSSRTVTIEITGTADKIEGFENMVRPVRPRRDGAHGRDRDRPRQVTDVARRRSAAICSGALRDLLPGVAEHGVARRAQVQVALVVVARALRDVPCASVAVELDDDASGRTRRRRPAMARDPDVDIRWGKGVALAEEDELLLELALGLGELRAVAFERGA